MSALLKKIDKDYKNIFENISEKNEILLKGKIYDGIVSNNLNTSIVSWADDFKKKYSSIFSDIKDLKYVILRHRIKLNILSITNDISIETIIDAIFDSISTP